MVSIGSGNFNKNQQKLGFGRAFKPEEMDVYTKKLAEARELYQITDTKDDNKEKPLNNTTMIHADFYAQDRTITSEQAMDFVRLMKQLNGINTIQTLPRGSATKPFESSPFEIDEKLIYPPKVQAQFGKSDLKAAYEGFNSLPETSPLKKEYNEQFIPNNPAVERFAIYEGLSKKHGTDDCDRWNDELDKNLFNYDDTKEPPKANKDRMEQVKKDYADEMGFYKFKQFVASKQHLEYKGKLNNEEGMKLFGDCLIGVSKKDVWAFKPAFKEGTSNPWGATCLDFDQLSQPNSPARRFQKMKFDYYLTNYDGVRIDAGHQLSHPSVNGQKQDLGNQLIDILRESITDQNKIREEKGQKKVENEDICFELLGGPGEAEPLTKNEFSHILITRYAGKGYGTNQWFVDNKGYKLDRYTIGVGCHDDRPVDDIEKGIIEFDDSKNPNSGKREVQGQLLAEHLKTPVNNAEEFRNAKFAELYTARNQFFTLPDIIGDNRRLNDPNNQSDSWKININETGNPERTYLKNLSEGKGLNTPKSRAIAIRAKMGENEKTKGILAFLDKAGRILADEYVDDKDGKVKKKQNKSDLPYTIAEAAKADIKDLGETLVDIKQETKTETKEISKTTSVEKATKPSSPEKRLDIKEKRIPIITIHGGFGPRWEITPEQSEYYNALGIKTTKNKEGYAADFEIALPVPPNAKGSFNFGIKKNGSFIEGSQQTVEIQ